MRLNLADGLSLPADVATQVMLIAGKRGSGKTNTAKRTVEQLHHAHVPFGVLDVVDVWWGLKAGKTGTREGGLPIYVFGGKHADYPLSPTGGRLMAGVFVDYRISAVMAMREWTGADRARFVTDFADELLQRNSEAFEVVVEEAHDLIPLVAMGEEKRSKGAMLRMEKLGRSSGIGMMLLTQRLAALDNTARSQADLLVMHRTTGPHDRKALNGWIEEHHADDAERQAFLGALPTLKTGEAFVWGPDFPEDKPLGLKRVVILPCETFNSHATPKVGEKRVEPKELTPVDLAALADRMKTTVEKHQAEDPKALREKNRALLAQVAKMDATITRLEAAKGGAVAAPKMVPVLKDEQLARLEKAINEFPIDTWLARFERVLSPINDSLKQVVAARSGTPPTHAGTAQVVRPAHVGAVPVRATAPAANPHRPSTEKAASSQPVRSGESRRTADPSGEGGLTSTHQAVLNAALFLESVGFRSPGVPQLALMSKLAPNSGYWRQIIGRLRSLGLMEGLSLTPAGRSQAVQEPLDGAQDVQRRAMAVLPSETHRKVLSALLNAYPNGLGQDELTEQTGLAINSGYGRQIVGRLRSLGVAGKGWPLAAAPFLFLEDAA